MLGAITALHVLISLAGIATGLVVAWGFVTDRRLDAWTSAFLWTTALASVTALLLPFRELLPSHLASALSLVVVALVVYARYRQRMTGHWRWIYVGGALLALYLNVFVLVPMRRVQLGSLIVIGTLGAVGMARFRRPVRF